MGKKTEAEILAEVFESARTGVKFYLSNLGDIDVYKRITINDKSFNSPYWIAAHLTWAEYYFLVECMGAEVINIPWLAKFGTGTESPDSKDLPGYEEVLKTMDEVHKKAMAVIKSLTDDQLDEPNIPGITIGGENSKRAIIKHAIRHEPAHIGQISWILKLNDIKMP